MKYKHILAFIGITLPIFFLTRLLMVVKFVDPNTGFFYPAAKNSSIFVGFFLVLGILAVSGISGVIRRCPVKSPKVNKPLGFSAAICGVLILISSFSTFTGDKIATTFDLIYAGVGIAAALFLFAYWFKSIKNFHLPRPLYVILLIYWLLRFVATYISISKISLLFENLFLVFSLASICVFMLEFAKISNGIHQKYLHKKVMMFSVAALSFSIVYSLPQLLAILFGFQNTKHSSVADLLLYLATALFVALYLISYFDNKNLVKKHHSKESTKILPFKKEYRTEK